jgi:tRNA threonylcarbamoyladenosine biosynthesis protein TsaB
VLALDTTGRAGSVALVADGRVLAERSGDPSRTHAERLPGELVELVEGHGLALTAIDLFAVAAGPGSFTGLRIGIATIQGLAFVTGRQVVAVSALEAMAQAASQAAGPEGAVAAWIDAQRGEVFAALYRVTKAPPFSPARLVELAGPSVAAPQATLDAWAGCDLTRAVFIGDGASRYAEVIAGHRGVPVVRAAPQLAGTIGCMAAVRAGLGQAIDPAAVRPLYVRRPDAVLDRERRAPGPPR